MARPTAIMLNMNIFLKQFFGFSKVIILNIYEHFSKTIFRVFKSDNSKYIWQNYTLLEQKGIISSRVDEIIKFEKT